MKTSSLRPRPAAERIEGSPARHFRLPSRATLTSRPVLAAALLFAGTMAVLLTAFAIASVDEEAVMRVGYEVSKAITLLVAAGTVARHLWGLAGRFVDAARRSAEERAGAREPEHRTSLKEAAGTAAEAEAALALRVLEDPGFAASVARMAKRRDTASKGTRAGE